MLRTLSLIALLGFILTGCATLQASKPALDTDLTSITSMLVGDYFSDAEGGAREGRPIYLRIRQIEPPAGHTLALYSEMRHDGPEGEYYRQLVYLFDETPDRTENSMLAYRVSDSETAARLVKEPSLLASGVVQLKPPIADTCNTVWSHEGAAYSGYLEPARCVITGKRGDKRRIESRMVISPDSIGQLERGYSLEGELLFGNPDGELYIWPRVTPAG